MRHRTGRAARLHLDPQHGHPTHRLSDGTEVRQAGLEALGAGTFHWLADADALTVDATLATMLGWSGPGPRMLDALLSCLHPVDRRRIRAACECGVADGVAVREPVRVMRPDGTVRWLDLRARVRVDTDRPHELIGACIDVTEACDREQGCSDFMAVVTHELRTPLNAIGGYTTLLLEGIPTSSPETQVAHLRGIERSYRHLISLVDAMLLRAKAGAGRVEYRLEDVSIGQILDDIEPLTAPQRMRKALAYDCSGCDHELVIRADREKVCQILLNLVANAVKFTPAQGTISVLTEYGEGRIALVVADTGIGMTAEELARLFEPFTNFGREAEGGEQGTGLGMSISREFARGMGGDITARSEAGHGSVFTLWLPAGARPSGP